MIAFFFVIICVILFLRVAHIVIDRRSCASKYREIGRRYFGKKTLDAGVIQTLPLTHPKLSFPYNDVHCTLTCRKSKSFFDHRRETRVTISLPQKISDFEITTSEFQDWRWTKLGSHRLVLGNEEFDGEFKVASKKPDLAKSILTSAVCWQLEQLRRIAPEKQLNVLAKGWTITIAVPSDVRKVQLLDDLVRLSLKTYDLIKLSKAKGVAFLEDDSVKLIEEVQCPICSETIETQMVVCVRCQTPHCQDCWEYNGECATYACQETRFIDVAAQTEEIKQ